MTRETPEPVMKGPRSSVVGVLSGTVIAAAPAPTATVSTVMPTVAGAEVPPGPVAV